jgi:peroxiredoxin Q/BCP
MQTRQLRGHTLVAMVFIMGLCMPISTTALEVGQPAPDFLMHGTVGETVRLSDYQGKKNVMLFFFLAAFTGA